MRKLTSLFAVLMLSIMTIYANPTGAWAYGLPIFDWVSVIFAGLISIYLIVTIVMYFFYKIKLSVTDNDEMAEIVFEKGIVRLIKKTIDVKDAELEKDRVKHQTDSKAYAIKEVAGALVDTMAKAKKEAGIKFGDSNVEEFSNIVTEKMLEKKWFYTPNLRRMILSILSPVPLGILCLTIVILALIYGPKRPNPPKETVIIKEKIINAPSGGSGQTFADNSRRNEQASPPEKTKVTQIDTVWQTYTRDINPEGTDLNFSGYDLYRVEHTGQVHFEFYSNGRFVGKSDHLEPYLSEKTGPISSMVIFSHTGKTELATVRVGKIVRKDVYV